MSVASSVVSSVALADPARLVRAAVRELPVYHLDLTPCRHKLDQNEAPFDAPRALKRRAARLLLARSWAAYPDFHSDELRAALGRFHDWPAAGVLVGNGSDELLGATLLAVARPGGEVLGAVPSFGLYRHFVVRAAAVPRWLGPRDDLRLPLAELRAEIERDPTRPLLLCTPNNPTGEALAPAAVESLLERLEAPLLLDNAYAEFCDHDYRPLLRRYPHLVIFRTFSKAFAAGGLRLGYLLADPRLAAQLLRVKMPYNVNFLSSAVGIDLLRDGGVARRVATIVRRRPQWAAMLRRAGLEVFPSEANFHLVRCRRDGVSCHAAVRDGLAARGILVRDVSAGPGLADCLRFAVGSGAALRDVERALDEILDEILGEIPGGAP